MFTITMSGLRAGILQVRHEVRVRWIQTVPRVAGRNFAKQFAYNAIMTPVMAVYIYIIVLHH